MSDPYKVLGIARDVTDDEVKKAYRALARKYHPDNYVDNPLSDLVSEKMKEINEAYDQIQKERAGGGASGGRYSNFSGGFAGVRNLINEGRYSEAELILNSASASDRNAEWNFLKGCVLLRRGWHFDAQKHFETACYMDPTNEEYKNAKTNLSRNADQYGRSYTNTGTGKNCSACDICSGLICADCLCECCGGDLIRCC